MHDKRTDERRALPRVPLDIPYFIRLSIIGGNDCKVMLCDISVKGLQADLPPGVGAGDIPVGAEVNFGGFPPEMEYLNRISGKVMWVDDGRCGIQFVQELESGGVLDFFGSL